MKRWALVVVGLYGLILTALTVPVIVLAFGGQDNLADVAKVYAYWPYWIWLVVMLISQAALLVVPVRVASRRPVSRSSLLPTILAAGLMIGGLAAGAMCSIYEFLFQDQGGGNWIWWSAIGVAVLSWCAWTLVFFRMSRNESPAGIISRQCRLLLKGSILELLIAVPTHIVARCRDYCCAGVMTFIGLAMGTAVMLFSFGPGVYFLFVERWQRLHPKLRPPFADENSSHLHT
jgi:hypothetical protein